MALIKTTAVVDAISGKLNGTVFAHNKGGQYMRSRSIVANPATPAQTAQRARMTSFSQSWAGLTQDQRDAWEAATEDWPYQNRLGDTKTLSGFGLYVRLNTNLALIGTSPNTDPMPKGAIRSFNGGAALPTFQLEQGGGDIDEITFSLSTDSGEGEFTETDRVLMRVTAGLSPGIQNPAGRLRMLAHPASSKHHAGPVTNSDYEHLIDDYKARFGIPEPGTKVFFELTPIGVDSGVRGARVRFAIPVTESTGS